MSSPPDFRSVEFLRDHVAQTMAFYHPRAIDPEGGFFHYFRDDGTVYDVRHRHLVSSARFVYVYAMAAREFRSTEYLEATHHGLRYLREVHHDPGTGGYAWTIHDGRAEDRSNHCYGFAFVLLAYAVALLAGLSEAKIWLVETWNLLERRFWEPDFGLYRDEATADWAFSLYRGQNANMHLCEALIVAYEATGNDRYLARAVELADRITRRQAAKAQGLVWEHYDQSWEIDWSYNRDDPKDLFRPWGFQAGHQTEWAKLLSILDSQVGEKWLLPVARDLFDHALDRAWDAECGGIYYGFAPGGGICDTDKYFWVQAETIAAAAWLEARTGESRYGEWYERIWDYAWRYFVDHRYGAWYRILDYKNARYSDEKSPAGKTDYHTMGACYEALRLLRRRACNRT